MPQSLYSKDARSLLSAYGSLYGGVLFDYKSNAVDLIKQAENVPPPNAIAIALLLREYRPGSRLWLNGRMA